MAVRNMTRKDTRKVMAVKIKTKNDSNGNPRRGWQVFARDGKFLGFIDEDYLGRRALTSLFPNALELTVLDVIPAEYSYYYKNDRITDSRDYTPSKGRGVY